MDSISLTPFFISGVISLIFMITVFLFSLLKKDNSIADIAWGIGFIIIGTTSFLLHPNYAPKQLLVLFLVILWGMRLAIHITMRNQGKTEDFRYQEWRRQWGKQMIVKSFFQVYIIQWIFMQLIASSIIIAITYGSSISTIDIIGSIVWIIGFLFETYGDYQLFLFKRNSLNKGKIMQSGVWKYTRHPNYFGEVTQWWGIFILAFSVPFGYFALISPLTISFLILKVSGIPLLEKKYEGNEEFEKYKKQTNAFIPWFSKIPYI